MGIRHFFSTIVDILLSTGVFLGILALLVIGAITAILGPIIGGLILLFLIIFVSVRGRHDNEYKDEGS